MKIKHKFNGKRFIVGSILIISIPIIICFILLLCIDKNYFTKATFWYEYMSYFGTVVLAAVAIWQNQKANEVSAKFDEINARQNYCFSRICDKFSMETVLHSDSGICISAHHKKDSQAIIFLAKDCHEHKTLVEFNIKLYFKDYSKTALKSFEIDTNSVVCVQEPSPNGLIWSKKECKDPIPTGFFSIFERPSTHPIWVEDNTYLIILKVYDSPRGLFAHMVKNPVGFCLMFNSYLLGVSGIETKMRYKYWINKDEDEFVLEYNESQLLEIS